MSRTRIVRLRKRARRRPARSRGDHDPVASRPSGAADRGAVGGDGASDSGAPRSGGTDSHASGPKTSWQRFEAPAPNERWQIDAMDWVIASGPAQVFNIIDDHSRVAVRSRAVTEATTEEAWTTFCQGGQRWGLPAGVLSDNGLCFSGKLRGFEVALRSQPARRRGPPITGRPYPPPDHRQGRTVPTDPQEMAPPPTPRPLDLAELQAQLDEFCRIYNHQRPHQGIGRSIPIERWNASSRSPAQPTSRSRIPTRHRPVVREATRVNQRQGRLRRRATPSTSASNGTGATATIIRSTAT